MNRSPDYITLNQANWDERVRVHKTSSFYDVEEFLAGADHLHGFEADELGEVKGRRLVHLQCHFGLDSLSLARRGAAVTGLDFSAPAIAEARRLADCIGIRARFVESELYGAVSALGETYEVVYTGKGALNWLPDLPAWAEVVAALLEPGGFLYLSEYHPFVWMMAEDSFELQYSYFNAGPLLDDSQGTYTDPKAILENTRTVEWAHPLSDVVSAVIGSGLRLDFLHEHRDCTYQRFSFMEGHGPRDYRLPASMVELPFMYSIRATRTA
ncbi:MAG: class I SAM-dependent methyltransferase [Acidimicrobiales bacterium]